MTDDEKIAEKLRGQLCGDCPPVGYSTDRTRCAECPRRAVIAKVGGEK